MIQGIPFWYGIGKAGAIGAVSGAVSFGIGSWAKTLFGELVTVGKALFQAGMHGLSGGLTSALESGSFKGFGAAFASGFASSLISSGVESLGQMDGGYVDAKTGKSIASYNSFGKSDWFKSSMIASGGVSGGISSMIAGGNFMDGFRQGVITSGLNHVAHQISSPMESMVGDDPKEDSPIMKILKAKSPLEGDSQNGTSPLVFNFKNVGSNWQVAEVKSIYHTSLILDFNGITNTSLDLYYFYSHNNYYQFPVKYANGYVLPKQTAAFISKQATTAGIQAAKEYYMMNNGNVMNQQMRAVFSTTVNAFIKDWGGRFSFTAPFGFK